MGVCRRAFGLASALARQQIAAGAPYLRGVAELWQFASHARRKTASRAHVSWPQHQPAACRGCSWAWSQGLGFS